MKKKFFITALVILLLILALLIVLGIRSSIISKDSLSGTDYPVTYKIKNGVITVNLDGHKTRKLEWTAEVADSTIVQVDKKGFELGGRAKFVITPLAAGTTRVRFLRQQEIAGTTVNVAEVFAPIYVSGSGNSVYADCMEAPKLVRCPTIMAGDTAFPVLINTDSENLPCLEFINGLGDWTVTNTDGMAELSTVPEGNKVYGYIKRKTPDTGADANSNNGNELSVILSSPSLGQSIKLKVAYKADEVKGITLEE